MAWRDLSWEGCPGDPNLPLLCACPPVTLRVWASTLRVTSAHQPVGGSHTQSLWTVRTGVRGSEQSFRPRPADPIAPPHSPPRLLTAVCLCGQGGAVIFIFILRTYFEPVNEKNLNLCRIFTFCPPSVPCPCRFREMKISREHLCRWEGGRGGSEPTGVNPRAWLKGTSEGGQGGGLGRTRAAPHPPSSWSARSLCRLAGTQVVIERLSLRPCRVCGC